MVSTPLTKRYIYQLMYNIQLPGSRTFYLQILRKISTQNNDVSMGKEFQKHMSKEHQKHGVIDQVKYIKRDIQRK